MGHVCELIQKRNFDLNVDVKVSNVFYTNPRKIHNGGRNIIGLISEFLDTYEDHIRDSSKTICTIEYSGNILTCKIFFNFQ